MLNVLQILLWVLVGIPFLLILLVFAAAMYGAYAHRCSIKIASMTACPNCGKVVGHSPVMAAIKRLEDKYAELRKQHPGVKFRIVAELEIHCPNCTAIFYFYPDGNKIERHSRFPKASQCATSAVEAP
jgi:hypothetical protein